MTSDLIIRYTAGACAHVRTCYNVTSKKNEGTHSWRAHDMRLRVKLDLAVRTTHDIKAPWAINICQKNSECVLEYNGYRQTTHGKQIGVQFFA